MHYDMEYKNNDTFMTGEHESNAITSWRREVRAREISE